MSLQNSLLTINSLLGEFFLSYGYNASDKEKAVYVEWAKYLTEEELKYALDTNNHFKSSSGQRMRPNLGTLKDIVFEYRSSRGDFRRIPLPDTSLPEEENGCPYCVDSKVYDFIETSKGGWTVDFVGTCTCDGGDAMPRQEVIDAAERIGVHVVELMGQTMIKYLGFRLVDKVTPVDLPKIIANWVKDNPPGEGKVLYEPDLEDVKIPF